MTARKFVILSCVYGSLIATAWFLYSVFGGTVSSIQEFETNFDGPAHISPVHIRIPFFVSDVWSVCLAPALVYVLHTKIKFPSGMLDLHVLDGLIGGILVACLLGFVTGFDFSFLCCVPSGVFLSRYGSIRSILFVCAASTLLLSTFLHTFHALVLGLSYGLLLLVVYLGCIAAKLATQSVSHA